MKARRKWAAVTSFAPSGVGAGAAAGAATLTTGAQADSETNDEKKKVALPRNGAREDLLPGQQISSEGLRGGRAVLIKKSDRQARRGALAAAFGNSNQRRPRPPHVPAPLRPCGRRPGRARHAAARHRAQGGSCRRRACACEGHHPAEHVHALLRRLHGAGRGRERRLGRAGAWLGQPDQSRLALRQGCRHARADARRPSPALPDEDGRRTMAADFVGYGDQRDRRQAAADPREVRSGFRLLAGLGKVHQRSRLPQSASSRRSGAPTTRTTRPASVIRPPSPA